MFLARAALVIDQHNRIAYFSIVPAVEDQPDYLHAFAAAYRVAEQPA